MSTLFPAFLVFTLGRHFVTLGKMPCCRHVTVLLVVFLLPWYVWLWLTKLKTPPAYLPGDRYYVEGRSDEGGRGREIERVVG